MFNPTTQIDTATKKLLRDPLKRRAWVIYQLGINGRSLADVGRENGVHRKCLYHALVKPYPRMEMMIARSLELTPQALFPERYDADGLPNRRMGRPKKVSGHEHKPKHSPAVRKRNTQTETQV